MSGGSAVVPVVLQSLPCDKNLAGLQSRAHRNQMLQSLGNESPTRVAVVLQSLLSDISRSIVVDGASRTASVLQQVEGSR